jgi:NADH-quinone oxidoreductase subunit L
MDWIVHNLWLIPAAPLLAAGLSALAPRRQRTLASGLAIGSMGIALALSLCAFAHALHHSGAGEGVSRQVFNFAWFQFGDPAVDGTSLRLGWVLDPLSAVMLVMVSFVGLLIFIYSVGYMAHDENFTRFFCFLALFASAMLGLIIANSLLLLFMCWEIVGLTSYLLIGFWYHVPSAAAAAKKAFITTRIGDLALLLGIVWLYSETGTLLFYDAGQGCLEHSALAALVAKSTTIGMAVSTGISLLIFCGAVGKSGQVPLHVWLPDAMEGPTPVSALIHAATMVAAGVFLVARMYPLISAQVPGGPAATSALQVITWVGVTTVIFGATVAVAQTDIKRILAYSTVSQLGMMMLGLGVGGVAVGMFHLITHAFFKALLFMGAGSVIHGCHEEQDIRRMGGLRKYMPATFATYAIGMLALSGFPILFSGFWSKDEILHSAHAWEVSKWPFYLGVIGALFTAFYMTRQVCYVFFGAYRGKEHPHESPAVMTLPLVLLAICSILLGFLGTPVWPWFQSFVGGEPLTFETGRFFVKEVMWLIGLSSGIVFIGIGLGWYLYGRRPIAAGQPDVLETAQPEIYTLLRRKYYFDELYRGSIIWFNAWWAKFCDTMDFWVWNGIVQACAYLAVGVAWVSRVIDEYVVNLGFDEGCRGFGAGGALLSRIQNGQVQRYLRFIGLALVVLVLVLIWGCRPS